VCKGGTFFALPGERVDGHFFLEEAAYRGAIGAVVDRSYAGSNFGMQLFYAENVLGCLQQLALKKLAALDLFVVGVTGSLGKTMTKEFLQILLQKRHRLVVSLGNQNSQIGLPLTILNDVKGSEQLYVQEMAMTEPGQIARLTEIAPPDIAVITTVALVHAMGFDSLEAIANAKVEIALQKRTKVLFVDHAVASFCVCPAHCEKRTFSVEERSADYFFDGSAIWEGGKKVCALTDFPLMGFVPYHNFLAAAIVAHECGVDWEMIAKEGKSLSLMEGRGVKVERAGITFIDDAYNAAEASVKAALYALPKGAKRMIAVLGEMVELGTFSEECHAEVGRFALKCVDYLFCLGEEAYPLFEVWKKAKRPCEHFVERTQLVEALKRELVPGDLVLLKGSNPLRLGELIDEVT